MESLLIFGGSGFIGRHLARELSADFRVTVCDRSVDRQFFERYPQIRCITFAFPDLPRLAQIVQEVDPAFVINLVSLVNADRDLRLFGDLIQANLNVVIELFEALKERERLRLFVQVGSAEEYGPIESPFRETSRETPASPYAVVKQATGNTILMLVRNKSFPAMVVRFGNVFGRFQPPDKLIPYVVSRLKRNEPLLLSPGEQKRDFIHAPDLAEPLRRLMKRYMDVLGTIVNVSSGEGITIRTVVEHLSHRLSSRSRIDFGALPYREGEMMDFTCDIGRLKELTGWSPSKGILDAFDEYLRDEMDASR